MEEKIHELRRIIQDKEYTIQELEKIKPQLNKEGVLIKYREIINPSEQVLKIQNENVNLIRNLSKMTKSTQDLEEENKKLKEKNFVSLFICCLVFIIKGLTKKEKRGYILFLT